MIFLDFNHARTHPRKNTLGFGDVCEEVNQDLRVKRVKRNVGLGVKMSPMYGRIDRGV